MSDMNAMTRIVGKHRVPCIVIDKTTGERLQRHAVDAKEMIATGRYEWATDVVGVPIQEVKVNAQGAPIALVDVVVPDEVHVPAVTELEIDDVIPEVEDVVVEDAKPKPTKKTVKGSRKK